MRFEKIKQILELARKMAATSEGLSLDDMAAYLGQGRRTAERVRDLMLEMFPGAEEIHDGRHKRFLIRGGLDRMVKDPTVEELSALEWAKSEAGLRGQASRARALSELETKIKASTRAAVRNRLEPDVEALVQAETLAAQAGPRPLEDPKTIGAIRHALLLGQQIQFVYLAGSRPGQARLAHPLGLMLGRKTYLVAQEVGSDGVKTYRLDLMTDVMILDALRQVPAGFDLQSYTSRSFGIYQDAAIDVILSFEPDLKSALASWQFHPSQQLMTADDGRIEVRFRSAGVKELAWHLVTWGDQVKIKSPEILKVTLRQVLDLAYLQIQT